MRKNRDQAAGPSLRANRSRYRVVAFFIPMPTPLAIPQGTVYTFLGERLPDVKKMIFAPVAGSRPSQLVQAQSFVSFRFWQTQVSPELWPGLDVVFRNVLPAGTVPENPPPPGASLPQTVVEATVLVSDTPGPGGDEVVSRAFDECLGKLRTSMTTPAWTRFRTRCCSRGKSTWS
jgi:hypothetical protein